jgi:hypothetical protein
MLAFPACRCRRSSPPRWCACCRKSRWQW